MKKADFLNLSLLIAIVLAVFYPLFTARYAYTDELVQLWNYRKGSGYYMFLPQGRYITEKLFAWLFSCIDTIGEIRYLRLFSLFGWICCIPVWYFILQNIISKEGLPAQLTFFALLYLVTCPPFSVYVQWASCMELFIANTAGLVSGYLLYNGIRETGVSPRAVVLSGLFGMISLLTYQAGFGCFFIPAVLVLLARKRLTGAFLVSTGVSLCIFGVYYIVFKGIMAGYHIVPDSRAGIHIDPLGKIIFFFGRPLAGAFHFTWLFNERSVAGFIVYAALLGLWIGATFFKRLSGKIGDRVLFFAGVGTLLLLTYLPSLLVRENYASNRTLLALDIEVFLLFSECIFSILKNQANRTAIIAFIGALFVVNAWYNFTRQFLRPVENEYRAVRAYIETKYTPGIKTIYFVRPPEDLFRKQYSVVSSWDEFGVPSTFFQWVPEYFCKQVILEKTEDRRLAEGIGVQSWLAREKYAAAVPPVTDSILVLDAELIITGR